MRHGFDPNRSFTADGDRGKPRSRSHAVPLSVAGQCIVNGTTGAARLFIRKILGRVGYLLTGFGAALCDKAPEALRKIRRCVRVGGEGNQFSREAVGTRRPGSSSQVRGEL